MELTYLPYDVDVVARLRVGGPDANGMTAERAVSDGEGKPCRCCLQNVPAGDEMLICAARPFPTLQPYAETGPIFLCAKDCTPHDGIRVPRILQTSPDYLLKAYAPDNRIIYGTGQITPADDIPAYAAQLLERNDVAYVDVRSARNNCFLTRIRPAS